MTPLLSLRLFASLMNQTSLVGILLMSIVSSHAEGNFGKSLTPAGQFGTGPCIDIYLHNNILWAIGSDRLEAFDTATPAEPKQVGSLEGLGNVRQIECEGTNAFVASREDGLFILDISRPEAPSILYHYDTLEKATGVAVSRGLVAVANRYYGVELLDVTNPHAPRYLATVLSGKEVQSVELQGDFLYAGIWASREVAIVDVSDPRNPRAVGTVPLDGYGDGVRVRDGLLFAATGHHSSAFKKPHFQPPASTDTGHGEGHGLEIFRVSNPSMPSLLSRLKTPPFYKGVPDMWSIEVSDSFAVLSDTFNGIFIVDISNPEAPRFVARATLPAKDSEIEPVAATAIGNGVVYTAGYRSGIFTFRFDGLKAPTTSTLPARNIPVQELQDDISETAEGLRYRPDGQVRSIALLSEDRAALALGNGGVHVVQLSPEFKLISVRKTEGIAVDVALRGSHLFVAETTKGISVWEIGPQGTLIPKGRYMKPGLSVHQIVTSESTPYAVIENGQFNIDILDLSDPTAISPISSEKGPGIFYGKWIAPHFTSANLAVAFWHMGGPVWFDLEKTPPARVTDIQAVVGNVLTGVWAYPDGRILVLHGNGLTILPPLSASKLGHPAGVLPEGESLNGLPAVRGNLLLAAAGPWRSIKAVDITDPLHPKLLEKWTTEGNPFRPVFWENLILVPEGRGGLMILKNSFVTEPSAKSDTPPEPISSSPSSGEISITKLPDQLGARIETIEVGAPRCSDKFLFEKLPESLQGLPLVIINRGEKSQPGASYCFTIDRPATVYLFIAQAGFHLAPEGWEETPHEAEWTFKDVLRLKDKIYAKDFPAGVVEIPANESMTDGYGPPHACAVAPL